MSKQFSAMPGKTREPLVTFRQWQADLLWAAESPMLTNLPEFKPTLPVLSDSNCADSDKRRQDDNCAPIRLTSRFLGPYFELLWRQLIRDSNNLQLLAQNLQIHDKGKTYGEFDIIVRETGSAVYPQAAQPGRLSPNTRTDLNESSESLIHQELAVKFYLGLPHTQANKEDSLWFGPNLIDRLDIKLHSMITAQSKLSMMPLVRKKLANASSLRIDQSSRIKPEIIMKGFLFHPYGAKLRLPPYVNPNAATGEWLALSKLKQLTEKHHLWAMLPKLAWLSTSSELALLGDQQMLHDCTESVQRFHSQMVAAVSIDKQLNIRQVARYFIVGDSWAESARATLKTNPLRNIPATS